MKLLGVADLAKRWNELDVVDKERWAYVAAEKKRQFDLDHPQTTQPKVKETKESNSVRKPNPYLDFCSVQRPILKEQGLNPDEIRMKLSELWKREKDGTKQEPSLRTLLGANTKQAISDNLARLGFPETVKPTTEEPELVVPKVRKQTEYGAFSKETRVELKKTHPELKGKELTEEVKRLWKEESECVNLDGFDAFKDTLPQNTDTSTHKSRKIRTKY